MDGIVKPKYLSTNYFSTDSRSQRSIFQNIQRIWMLAGCIFLLQISLTFARNPDFNSPHHPEQLLVRFKPNITAQQRTNVHARIGAVRIKNFHVVNGLMLVKVPHGRLKESLRQYQANPHVLYVEPNYEVHAIVRPQDSDFPLLWGLENTGQEIGGELGTAGADIRATQAWEIWTGDPNFKIAVVDTGVNYEHPDLMDNIWTNFGEIPDNGIDDDVNGYVDDIHGYDFLNDDGDPMDDHFHGSHVSGTIGAVGNNGIGVTGINWRCKIVGLKFLGAGGRGFIDGAMQAVQYAIDNNIKVSNHSWGGGGFSQAMYDTIQASQSIGHIFIAAAGNSANDNDTRTFYPASYDLPNIISVAATDHNDNLAGFSSYGFTTVDLGAPGVSIYSTSLGFDYRYASGTSMATPHVTGVTALLMSRFPQLPWTQIKDRLLNSVRPIPSLSGITVTGGILDAVTALGDCNLNGVDDAIDIFEGTSEDCSGNGVPDECEPDCNTNNIADSCDIVFGTSTDCDGLGIPDECDPDCNNNGITDSCDIDLGTSQDCDGFGVPDECEDCNNNQVGDRCDIRDGTSEDCNNNVFPDECEPNGLSDCNANSITDLCDVYLGISFDCNENSFPDECDIDLGTSEDCSGNGIPDECEPDCNENTIADTCDIVSGTSEDCTGNEIPDECEPDCNKNGSADSCDILSGTSTDINENGIPDDCGVFFYVDKDATGSNDGSNWTNAYTSLQDGLDAADLVSNQNIDTMVLIAEGTYVPTRRVDPGDPRTASFEMVNYVSIMGGFRGGSTNGDDRDLDVYITTLSGDINGDDGPDFANNEENVYIVVIANNVNDKAIINGVTISGGHADNGSNIFGAGMFLNGNPVVSDCIIKDNESFIAGGGMFIFGNLVVRTKPHIQRCEFSNNLTNGYGGGLSFIFSSPIIEQCSFINNVALLGNGGVDGGYGDPQFIECLFINNSAEDGIGGGMRVNYTETTISNSRFIGNSASSGGALVIYNSNVNIHNCGFFENSSTISGSAIFTLNGSVEVVNSIFAGNNTGVGTLYIFESESFNDLTLINSTIVGNTSSSGDSGLLLRPNTRTLIRNTILWNNGGSTESNQINHQTTAIVDISYSCVHGWGGSLGGVGNTGDDPLFVDVDGPDNIPGNLDDNLRLLAVSPLVNRGDRSALPIDSTDLDGDGNLAEPVPIDRDGHKRVLSFMIDMGAYEIEDCNDNGSSDEDDITLGTSGDCNANLYPDECELECNENNIPDECDIAVGTSEDCTGNDIPDECEPDCNNNMVADSCDIAFGTSSDDNNNGVPDECTHVIYVDIDAAGLNDGTNWTNAFTSLQNAMDQAVMGEGPGIETQIWIAEGTYIPTLQTEPEDFRTATFQLSNSIILFGGFAGGETDFNQRNVTVNTVILSGDIDGNDGPNFTNMEGNTYHVVTAADVNQSAILDGVTITGGNADGPSFGISLNSKDRGSGLFVLNASPQFYQCIFRNNIATYAGAVYSLGDASYIDCEFKDNQAGVWGGGLYITGLDGATITSCQFTNNSTTSDENSSGGGGATIEGRVTLTDCIFTQNKSNKDGGGIYNLAGSIVRITRCQFIRNETDRSGGGAINIFNDIQFHDCLFQENSVKTLFGRGAGLLLVDSAAILNHCDFIGNQDETLTGKGGGLHIAKGNNIISYSRFINNKTLRSGGGLYLIDGFTAVYNSVFYNNTSSTGAGIYITSSSSQQINSQIVNCTLIGNAASTSGGGIYIVAEGANTLINSTVFGNSSGNSVGAGIYLSSGITHLESNNNILWNNGDLSESSQITLFNSATISVNHNCIQNWSGTLGGVGNIGNDPLFFDPDGADNILGNEDDDFRLLAGSPALNTGDNSALPQDLADLDDDGDATETIPLDLGGNTRVLLGTVDMGAYEQADCNNNGVPDDLDISGGTSQDCTGNGLPDECEPDCNNNTVADSCDIAEGTSIDCNTNSIPDVCDIASNPESDCNMNNIPDTCDIASGTSDDCNGNNIPDLCDVIDNPSIDCNVNGIPDTCDIASGTSDDCNGNGNPDLCDLVDTPTLDCNGNQIPDTCDIASGTSQDSNGNNIPDVCEQDCNNNGIPDGFDIIEGTSTDCNTNIIPDECELTDDAWHDCNGNGFLDTCDITQGTSSDVNENCIPDECNQKPVPLAEISGIDKNRYISFTPVRAGCNTAIRVTLRSLYHPDPPSVDEPDFTAFEGNVRWVGPYDVYHENDLDSSSFFAASLQCDSYFADWSTIDLLHVFGSEILPSSIYDLQVVGDDCADLNDPACYSSALEIVTGKWGDVIEPYWSVENHGQPNIDDVLSVVKKWLGTGFPIKVSAQLQPNVLNPGIGVSINDVLAAVNAWLSASYPLDGPSTSCP